MELKDVSTLKGEKKMNSITVMGNVTKEPEINISTTGNSVARYTIADNQGKDKVNFIDCVCFGKNAEFADKYLKKGTKILVEGTLDVSNYEKQDGTKGKSTKVIVNRHHFCESKKAEEDFGSMDELPFV